METFDNESNEITYSYPGVYTVYCITTGYGIYGQSENVYESLVDILWKLRGGEFEDQRLQEEFVKCTERHFRFVPIDFGEALADPEARQAVFDKFCRD